MGHAGGIGRGTFLLWPVCVAAFLAGGWILTRVRSAWWTACPFLALTGAPCPTCGGTRAVLDLYRGDVVAAFRANPLVALLFLSLGVSGVVALVLGIRGVRVPRPRARAGGRLLAAVALVLILLNWVYLILARY